MKRVLKIICVVSIAVLSITTYYAITRLYYTKSVTSSLQKKKIFTFDLTTTLSSQTIGPGDQVSVNPVVKNTSTEKMYVFMTVDAPIYDEQPIYTLELNDDWVNLNQEGSTLVYAYADDIMKELVPGEMTSPLTDNLTMKNMTNSEFSEIQDINVTITAYAIDTLSNSSNPESLWNEIKLLIE